MKKPTNPSFHSITPPNQYSESSQTDPLNHWAGPPLVLNLSIHEEAEEQTSGSFSVNFLSIDPTQELQSKQCSQN